MRCSSPRQFTCYSYPAEQIIPMGVLVGRTSPNQFILRKGVPVKWISNGQALNECNKAILVPQYALDIRLHPGAQTVELTPRNSDIFPWRCWMDLIPGSFIAVGNPRAGEAKEVTSVLSRGSGSLEMLPQHASRDVLEWWYRQTSP